MECINLGDKIAGLRKGSNLTQKQLAKKLNVSNQLISKWETNLAVPSLDYLLDMCKIFDKSINFFTDNNDIKVQQYYVSKNDKPKVRKTLSKKGKVILASTLSSVFGVMLVVGIILLSIFCFVPMSKKQAYIAEISSSIKGYLDKYNFFNLKYDVYFDKNNTTKELKGYINENGVNLYDSVSKQDTIKDNIVYHNVEGGANYKTQLEKDYSLYELFDYALENTLLDDDFEFNYNDLYLRKVKDGFYVSIKKDIIKKFMDKEEGPLDVLSGIYGNIIIKEGVIEKAKLNLKVKDNSSNKNYTILINLIFSDEKPEVDAEVVSGWGIKVNSNAEEIALKLFENKSAKIFENLSNEDVKFLSNASLSFYNNKLWAFGKNLDFKLVAFDEITFEKLHEVDLNSFSLNNDCVFYKNLLLVFSSNKIYSINLDTLKISELYSVLTTFNFNATYNQFAIYSFGDRPIVNGFVVVDMQNLSVANINLSQSTTKFYIRNNYICYENDFKEYFKYDIVSKTYTKFVCDDLGKFLYISDSGDVFYRTYNSLKSIVKVGSNFKFRDGDMVNEVDGKLYVYDYTNKLIYIYDGENLIDTISGISYLTSLDLQNKDLVYVDANYNIFIKNKNYIKTIDNNSIYFKDLVLVDDNKVFGSINLLYATDDYILCYNKNSSYVLLYKNLDIDSPVLVANLSNNINNNAVEETFRVINANGKTILLFDNSLYIY